LVQENKKPDVNDWIIGGKYAKYSNIAELKANPEYWKKREMIGIVAKMRGNRMRSNKPTITKQEAIDIWIPILKAKFNNNPRVLDVLRKTENTTLVEVSNRLHTKPIGDWIKHKWEGHVHKDTGLRYGHNWMGDILMQIRSELCDITYVPWVSTATEPALSTKAVKTKASPPQKRKVSSVSSKVVGAGSPYSARSKQSRQPNKSPAASKPPTFEESVAALKPIVATLCDAVRKAELTAGDDKKMVEFLTSEHVIQLKTLRRDILAPICGVMGDVVDFLVEEEAGPRWTEIGAKECLLSEEPRNVLSGIATDIARVFE
jgi:predicted NAD-dependent protein-ADP-ribosyltransferase YbiA (DUF1768 family)